MNVALQDIVFFLNIAPTYLDKLRKEIHIPSAPVNLGFINEDNKLLCIGNYVIRLGGMFT